MENTNNLCGDILFKQAREGNTSLSQLERNEMACYISLDHMIIANTPLINYAIIFI